MKRAPRILYFVVGVGAGNTTRTLAILEELKRQRPGADIQFAVQGNALRLLRERFPVHEMRSVTYGSGSGGMDPLAIVRQNLAFPARFAENRRRAEALMRKVKPDIVVSDSDFYCLGAAKRLGIPLATVNSSPATVAQLRKYGVPPGCWFSGNIIERIDGWLQHRYPDRVVAPVIRPMRGVEEKVRQVPVIVRSDLAASSAPENRGGPIVVVTGGSGIGTAEIDLRGVQAPMVTFGTKLAKVPRHAEQRGFDLNAFRHMRTAGLLVVQGGFSSVSEALALRIPTLVIPIAGHAEQMMNAREAEATGRAAWSNGIRAGAAVQRLWEDRNTAWDRCRARPFRCDGACIAAQAILEMAP